MRIRAGSGQTPELQNVYAKSLSAYWADLAAWAGIRPEEGLLHSMKLTYEQDGSVKSIRLGFLTERGRGNQTWYTIYQDRGGKTSASRSTPTVDVKDVMQASVFFQELDEVGLRELEAYSGVQHPLELNLRSYYGSFTLKERGHVIQDGKVVPVQKEPVTLKGGQGHLYIMPEQHSGSIEPYVVPKAVTQ